MKLLKLALILLVSANATSPLSVRAQGSPERFWIAGRYDGNRVIVYFDAVKFDLAIPPAAAPPGATKIPLSVADGFFSPVALPASYIAQFQRTTSAERFKLGDRYDLLLGDGYVVTFTLTTLVGFHSDEQVGNDSYIGALGTVDRENSLLFQGNYFVAKRHEDRPAKTGTYPRTASRVRKPIPFDVQTQIASRMRERLKSETRLSVSALAEGLSPAFITEPFTLADGSLRYHVRAEWRAGREVGYDLQHAFAAWLTSAPTLRILATEQLSFGSDANIEEELLAVVDLGQGRTGAVVSTWGGDTRAMRLVEYRDGLQLSQMRTLQIIAFGE